MKNKFTVWFEDADWNATYIKCESCGSRHFDIAFSEVEIGNRPSFEDFGEAQKYHWKLNENSMIYE